MAARIIVTLALLLGGGWLAFDLLAEPKPTNFPKETSSDLEAESELKYLAALHRNAVEVFIDRSGFGKWRQSPPYVDIIASPEPLVSNNQGSISEPEQPKIDPKKPAKDKDLHFTFQDKIKGNLAVTPRAKRSGGASLRSSSSD